MEKAIKHLREGFVREEQGAPLAVVHDGLDAVGGRDVFIKLCHGYLAAVVAQRAQATHLYLVTLEKDARSYALHDSQHAVTVIDARACSWDLGRQETSSSTTHETGSAATADSLEELETLLMRSVSAAASSGQPHGIIIDSLSQLLLQHPAYKVFGLLSRLQSHAGTSCILTLLHKDLHDEPAVAGVDYMSTCSVKLQTLGHLHREVAMRHMGVSPHGYISFRYKRRAGRVHAESLLYTLMASGAINMAAPPAALAAAITAEALVAAGVKQQQLQHAGPQASSSAFLGSASPSAPTAPPAGAAASPRPPTGGMRMALNEQEQQAKDQVRLPYEHQGQGKEYQTGDFRDYLPSAAGGHAGATHLQDIAASQAAEVSKLGHILYIRDSEEEHDSDEDPDDDLDI